MTQPKTPTERIEDLLAEHDAILSADFVPATAAARLQEIEDECFALLGERQEKLR
jgi:hypothetical protein